MTPQQPQRMIEIDSRLVRTGAVLTAAGAALAWTGMAIAGFALVTAGRRMLDRMDTTPSEQAAVKWRQAREASRAGMQAWQSASDAGNGQMARF
ncbi:MULTISPECIES: hypothetical protein [unclassified Streptomyces]|uniref:hypothetical protein n=1 Tax=unclassified Streptomyces TaxID=2593676 RepID=UPI000B81D180|nr:MULTISPECIES: hypothetical protein [unclassified Streptomyces]MYS23474.1 hypothetical protein [Streptomyces sp. SID4948]